MRNWLKLGETLPAGEEPGEPPLDEVEEARPEPLIEEEQKQKA